MNGLLPGQVYYVTMPKFESRLLYHEISMTSLVSPPPDSACWSPEWDMVNAHFWGIFHLDFYPITSIFIAN